MKILVLVLHVLTQSPKMSTSPIKESELPDSKADYLMS